MYISKIKIDNYKCFLNSSEIELTQGFNIVAGQNNAGKTAFLEALSLNFTDKPHRSHQTVPQRGVQTNQHSSIMFSVSLSGEELRNIVLVPGSSLNIPIPANQPNGAPNAEGNWTERASFINWLLGFSTYEFNYSLASGKEPMSTNHLYLGIYQPKNPGFGGISAFGCSVDANGNIVEQIMPSGAPIPLLDINRVVASYVLPRVYHFHAKLFARQTDFIGIESVLKPDSENLAPVLSLLAQSNPKRFARYCDMIHDVLPSVRLVGTRLPSNQNVEIIVYTGDDLERDDLAVPLAECGSGVGQVLAILYVVMNSNTPLTILIDEPQSFLHPGAIRKLIAVLRQHPEHQYIIATHSPTVITAANPSTITIIKQKDGISDFHVIDPKENEELRGFLEEIGASLSDVFGADNILWVEGPTEQQCFPLILDNAGVSLQGTAIIGITHTGDLEGKHKKTVWEIYKRLSDGAGLLPPAKSFLFDRDKLLSTQPDKLTQDSKNKIRFLRRKMYENYLLDAEAIVARMNEIEGFREKPVELGEVGSWIKEHGGDPKYKAEENVGEAEWLKTVDGANLLLDLFNELSETRVPYEKTRDSVALTRWFIEHKPEQLREISDLLMEILKTSSPPA